MLLAVPLDIIHEIFGYLDSIDLLNLARTNKQLRDFLMSRKKTKAMWRVARQNLNIEGLPDCPIYMSEPAYANITFGHYCHKCLRLGLHEVVWEFSARYCAECLKSHEVAWPEMYTDIYFTRVLGDRSQFKWTHYLVCYSPDGTRKLYPCSAREKLVREITERTEDEDAMDAYLVDTRDLVETIQSQAREYHDWYKSTLSKRLQNIVAKLREEGWGADLNKMSEEDFAPLRSYPNVTILKPLTNDEWHDIRGHIIAGLEQYREARIRRERPAILRARLSDLRRVVCELQLGTRGYRTPETEYGPQFADIALMPEFRALVEASIDVEIKRSTFRGVCSQLPALFARFNTNRPAILAGMFSQRIGRPTSPTGCTKILDLAIAWFHCDGCKRYLRSPGVFAHQCQRPHYRDTEREEFDDPYVYDVAVASTFHAWSTTKLRPVLEEDLGGAAIAHCIMRTRPG
ncbi:hypothetical protein EVJ58_g6183 [Rhodofomes roseus]|uniref:F-box domain-containing protein n=1 Tax=Rhodofomes roseus TaxID=34475 RepID=A0A4Y9YAR1_9APHY|nr:hypothetical protein EVJ58_g6183 [Rhodofomes roseus]